MDFPSEFTLAEMVELESIYKDIGEASLDPEFCQRLATSFSFSVNRAGKPAITCEQVLSWFLEKQNPLQSKVTSPSVSSKLLVDLSDASFPDDSPQSSPKSKGSSAADLSELTFEAKSSKDNAWYDIASFHNYRVLCTGELEVRVRFAGYSNIHDEWVNLKRAVRERSIPLEPSECEIIQVGDLVLCFQVAYSFHRFQKLNLRLQKLNTSHNRADRVEESIRGTFDFTAIGTSFVPEISPLPATPFVQFQAMPAEWLEGSSFCLLGTLIFAGKKKSMQFIMMHVYCKLKGNHMMQVCAVAFL